MEIIQKTAIVTGAGMGIGRAIASLFARQGARVAVVDFQPHNGKDTVDLIQQQGGQAFFVQADVSSAEQIQAMVAAVTNEYKRIDILINNAGIDLPQATNVVDTTVEDWEKIHAVNLKGTFLCCKYTLPEMKKHNSGTILNIASVAAFSAVTQETAYGSSKAAQVQMTRQMAVDFAPWKIRVNSISPGPMEHATRDRLAYLQKDATILAKRQSMGTRLPLGRMCVPEDIANAALFLVSDKAAMITGTDLLVDGGFLLVGML